jgi:hypothetical protein
MFASDQFDQFSLVHSECIQHHPGLGARIVPHAATPAA